MPSQPFAIRYKKKIPIHPSYDSLGSKKQKSALVYLKEWCWVFVCFTESLGIISWNPRQEIPLGLAETGGEWRIRSRGWFTLIPQGFVFLSSPIPSVMICLVARGYCGPYDPCLLMCTSLCEAINVGCFKPLNLLWFVMLQSLFSSSNIFCLLPSSIWLLSTNNSHPLAQAPTAGSNFLVPI